MTWISNSMTGLGLLFLTHACYSAHEHSALQTIISSSSTNIHDPLLTISSPATTQLPLDIIIETVLSVVMVCMGLVMGMPELKPIVWRVWAGGIERAGDLGQEGEKGYVGNPFSVLESRPGFVDVRRQRVEFTRWVKEGGNVGGKGAL